MTYAGNPDLDQTVQQRVLTAFKEAVRLYREGHSEEARTILRSIADVDASFTPAQRLEQAIEAGAPVDLAQLIGEVAARSDVNVEETVAKARQALADRDVEGASALVQTVLRELPGHPGARQLAAEIQAKSRAGGEVQAHLERARQALDAGLAEEARGFLKLARNLDPANSDLGPLERRLQLAAQPLATAAEPDFEFEVFEHPPAAAAAEPAPPTPGVAAAPVALPAPPAAPAAPAPPPAPPPGPPVGGMRFDDPGASAPVDFQASLGDEFDAAAPGKSGGTSSRVAELLEQGQQEYDRGDFQGAVDTWSRIYLIDVSNAEADRRIEEARQRRGEVDRQAEQYYYEAREAFDQKRFDDARQLCQRILLLVPQHLEAHDLLQRLETPAAPPPTASTVAAEEDLFRDEFLPAPTPPPAAASAVRQTPRPAAPAAAAPEPSLPMEEEFAPEPVVAARRAPLPLAWIGVGLGVLVLVGVAALLLKGKVFSGGRTAVTAAIAESEQLARQGRLQDAIQLLQSIQGGTEGELANRVNQRVLEYQRRLRAKEAPRPVANAEVVKSALAEGRRVKAMSLIREGLAKVPGDAELAKLQSEITTFDPGMPALADAVASRNWESIRSLTDQLLKGHPGDPEALRLWSVATFNIAVLHLRKYQVAEGHDMLVDLSKRIADPDADRLQQLAKSYLSRPVDPRYQIYVTNVDLRQAE